jgi:asparagine synthase (glutamine-hydrolysing)
MCGIAGAIGRFGSEGGAVVQSMVSALAHRGPDDSGTHTWTVGSNVVALGHTRLSILDLSSAGHQPMFVHSGRYWIVFNGEIYNFQELRKLLDPQDVLFHSASDTEAILHAYHRWSNEAFRTFRGMFAFALVDRDQHKVHLVRDPFGIKPLYYHVTGDRLLFASEVNALLSSGAVPRRIDENGIRHFLDCGWVGNSATLISGVQMLQPGHMLTVDISPAKSMTWDVTRYERESDVSDNLTKSDSNESTAHMLHLLEQSVKYHLVSDVPVGLFLSGGIDSTALLHLMHQSGCIIPKTFTVVFAEKDFTEGEFARQVANHYDTEHREIDLSESDLLPQLPAALAAMDQPTMDGVNTYVIARAVRSAGVKVALSGLGADELFAGYPSFRRARWAQLIAKVPLSLRATMANGGRALLRGAGFLKLWDLVASDCTAEAAYRISRRLFASPEIDTLVSGRTPVRELAPALFFADPINEVSRLEMDGYMTGLLLRDTDFMSMASSLEVRVPFIDKAVVRHALQMPGGWKLAGNRPKPLLLESMRGAIPDYVWNRKKMGFVFPFDKWMRSALRHQVEETLTDKRLAEAVGLESKAVHQVWRRFLAGSVRWSQPWSLFVLLRWCERQRVSI